MIKKINYCFFLFCVFGLFCVTTSFAQNHLEQMISPISNPFYFEDPRARTEIRPIYLVHEVDKDFTTRGGDLQMFALQLRWAISDEFAFIMNKAGYIDFDPDSGLTSESGFSDIGLGFKSVLARDQVASSIVTWGLRFDVPVGDSDVLQGENDGAINPFLSGAVAMGSVNLMGSTGLRIPFDNDYSSFWDLDVHFDFPMGPLYPTFETNLIHVFDGGNQVNMSDEGMDIINFGASGADGKTVVTAAFGARYRVSKYLDWGISYQVPLTDNSGSNFIDWRLTADFIYSIPG